MVTSRLLTGYFGCEGMISSLRYRGGVELRSPQRSQDIGFNMRHFPCSFIRRSSCRLVESGAFPLPHLISLLCVMPYTWHDRKCLLEFLRQGLPCRRVDENEEGAGRFHHKAKTTQCQILLLVLEKFLFLDFLTVLRYSQDGKIKQFDISSQTANLNLHIYKTHSDKPSPTLMTNLWNHIS